MRLDYKPVVVTRYQPMERSTDGLPPFPEQITRLDVTLKIARFIPRPTRNRTTRNTASSACRPTGSLTVCRGSRMRSTAP